jgi:hypothetical protein
MDTFKRNRERLAKAGRLLEAGWMGIYKDDLPGMTGDQVEDVRDAFFCGAGYLVEIMMEFQRLKPQQKGVDGFVRCMQAICEELREFHKEADEKENLQ